MKKVVAFLFLSTMLLPCAVLGQPTEALEVEIEETNETPFTPQWWKRLSRRWKQVLSGQVAGRGAYVEGIKISFEGNPSPADLAQLSQATAVFCQGMKINSLRAIQDMTKLRNVDCSRNEIAYLTPLRGLHFLEQLNCSHNDIRYLHALKNSSLKKLDCSFNRRLVSVDELGDLYTLEVLDCENTRFDSLNGLADLFNLRAFNCSFTLITNIDSVANFRLLRQLDCSNLRITNLDALKQLTELETLHCDNTQIASLQPLDKLPKLELLTVQYTGYLRVEEIARFQELRPKCVVIMGE